MDMIFQGGAVSRMRTRLHTMQFGLWDEALAGERLPLRQGIGAALLECLTIDEMAFEIKMVVDVGVD